MEEKRANKHNHPNWKRKLLYFLLILFLSSLGVGGYFFYEMYTAANKSFTDLERAGNKSSLRKQEVTIGDDPLSILLVGVENYSTGGQNGRADTLIVVTLNPETDSMTMTTIPRDTMVEINQVEEYAGTHKINAAYTFGSISGYGGSKLTVETVENLLDIPIDKYIAVDFEGFKDIVDALGGVTIDVKEGFWEKNIYQNNERIYFEQGPMHLNGEEALAFVRMRKRDVNVTYPREERQRQFIRAVMDETISAGTILKVDKISDILGENIETNFKPKEIYGLERTYASASSNQVETLNIEGTNERVNGLIYFVPNETGLATISEQLKQQLQLKTNKTMPTIYKANN
ncbi:LCP family protein [Aquibacillus salsiterrae]|uniref:LCP family protein n=1 Tax=Aquibacillus salsiterrae TaxID=2950439 RepID=A0A9X3WI10_9BACI|nr:LCP family protein [Aquibacillus salsiterrae]MDC3417754.1 LCP family protein [Aquibacillus salsiterrae]